MVHQQNGCSLKILFILMISVSLILALVGLGFIAMYAWEGVISRIGDPDQSLLFWYLPILFIGIFSLVGGVAMFLVCLKKLRQ